ncbi:hypothetical protein, unlikely [Trypanosoma brucei gambiense DAL972]|uniref:Uncharacterized protein n=1 Tax=Trypanosoma brucei gambiense (strain MHOM/CI/86/DAL972) TaxID=679716 RepID=C9ZU06_TRYB9|nr:hypothetical protein, unlikely [Trypanosoma brucei gambiense DAL972]CBH12892.1 hypothetical protein, unlikely [Trypanosoma brucei gambiense DAL972]|eukprot:XP_011775171.1 hypothetical protein, unlikely [Trypanosoma brucei gambiense DAL972]
MKGKERGEKSGKKAHEGECDKRKKEKKRKFSRTPEASSTPHSFFSYMFLYAHAHVVTLNNKRKYACLFIFSSYKKWKGEKKKQKNAEVQHRSHQYLRHIKTKQSD